MNAPRPSAPARSASSFGGIACMLTAMMCFAALDTTTKIATATVSVMMAAWVRFLFQTVTTAAVLLPTRRAAFFRTRKPGLHLLRGMLLLGCNTLAMLGLRYTHVAEFTAIVMLTPLILTVVAAWALREPISMLRWACVLGGFAGTVLVIRPSSAMFQWATLLPLLLVAVNTAFQALTSRLARTDDAGTMHFYTGLTGLAITSAALPFTWQEIPSSAWAILTLMGLLGTLGHFLLIVAYGKAPVVVLTPYLYAQVGFAAIAGWLVFDHLPDQQALAGIAFITACGVYGTWLTAKESRRSTAARREGPNIDVASGTFPR